MREREWERESEWEIERVRDKRDWFLNDKGK